MSGPVGAVLSADRRWTGPNLLTLLRAALAPVVLALLVAGGPVARWWALAAFVVAALTDTVDGTLARRTGGVTHFGALADPIADKVLVIGTLGALAVVGDVGWWVVAVVVVREVAVTVLRARLVVARGLVMPASGWGKAKTIVQLVALGLLLVPGGPRPVAQVALGAAVVLTVGSGAEYVVRAARLARAHDAAHAGAAPPDAARADEGPTVVDPARTDLDR